MDFAQKFDFNKGTVGKGSAVFVRPIGEEKYRLFLPLETTIFVEGDVETHEYRLTTSTYVSKTAGYTTIEDKDVEFVVHSDFVERLKELEGQKLDFLSVSASGVAQQFTAEYKYRINDASDDIHKGTIRFVSASVGQPVKASDILPLIMPTVIFTNSIPTFVSLASATGTASITIETQPTDATITVTSNNTSITANYSQGKVTITGANISETEKAYATLKITSSKTGYASWSTYVEVDAPVVVGS